MAASNEDCLQTNNSQVSHKNDDLSVEANGFPHNVGSANSGIRSFRNRNLIQESDVFTQNAWFVPHEVSSVVNAFRLLRDDVKWSEQLLDIVREKIAQNSKSTLSIEEREKFENEASFYWDNFYEIHKNKFFKDRHWLVTEFPELFNADENIEKFTVLELGCGVGNTVFPLLQMNKIGNLFLYCCDFSTKAIDILKENEAYNTSRCLAFVNDISNEWTTPFPENSIDVIIMIFTLSAIAPDKMPTVVKEAVKYLKPNGLLLFRDYGRNDLAQIRFKPGRCLEDNYYVRGDGTRVYFFSDCEIDNLFTAAGLTKESILVDKRLVVNRSRQLKMYRLWIQAKFRKKSGQI